MANFILQPLSVATSINLTLYSYSTSDFRNVLYNEQFYLTTNVTKQGSDYASKNCFKANFETGNSVWSNSHSSSQYSTTVCRGLGNSSNVITGPWQPGQFNERAGCLVSRSLTLALFDNFNRAPKIKKKPSTILLKDITSYSFTSCLCVIDLKSFAINRLFR